MNITNGDDTTKVVRAKNLVTGNTNTSNIFLNAGYGSQTQIYGCRAWVNFNGSAAGTFAGGTSTVTRVAASTLCTVTTTTPHNLLQGHIIYATSGVVTGAYSVASATANTFTFNTVETTALTNVPITFNFNSIVAGQGVSSVANVAVGIKAVNFSFAFPDTNYCPQATLSYLNAPASLPIIPGFYSPALSSVYLQTQYYNNIGYDCVYNFVTVFR